MPEVVALVESSHAADAEPSRYDREVYNHSHCDETCVWGDGHQTCIQWITEEPRKPEVEVQL